MIPVLQRPAWETISAALGSPQPDGTYESEVARAEEDLDQNPAHLAERECASRQKSESLVEPFAVLVFRSNKIATLRLTKIKYEDQCEELDEVFGLVAGKYEHAIIFSILRLTIAFRHGSSVPKYGCKLNNEQILQHVSVSFSALLVCSKTTLTSEQEVAPPEQVCRMLCR